MNRHQRRAQLQEAQERLAQAEQSESTDEVLSAQLSLALAYFNNGKYPEGLEAFDLARDLSQQLEDPNAQARVIGTQILAYQSIDRLPDAFNLANEMIALAEEYDEAGIRADGLRFRGETLLESGKPTEAFEELSQALAAAKEADDPVREMAVNGSLGHLSLIVAVPDKAEGYFDRALELARQVGDTEAESGYLGNKGSVMSWRGEFQEAVDVFNQVLELAQEINNKQGEINARFHLAKAYARLNQPEQAIENARIGLELAEKPDPETLFSLLEIIILSHYKLNQIEQAQAATEQAIKAAKQSRDQNKELQMLISLGESFLGAEQPEQAIDTYQVALELARSLDRGVDVAHLIGRIATANAEIGNLTEAVDLHLKAIELAVERELAELEGDQRCLLALSYQDLGEIEAATQQCQLAIEAYHKNDLQQGVENAQQLLAQIQAGQS